MGISLGSAFQSINQSNVTFYRANSQQISKALVTCEITCSEHASFQLALKAMYVTARLRSRRPNAYCIQCIAYFFGIYSFWNRR